MRLPFTLDPQVIHHIIHSQAGSIGKALIELIMNSVDAQADRLELVVTQEGFSAQDDGKGFVSRDDIVQYFGRFGTPHEEGDATFGRFRLGRGQIMAHAITVWQSQRWQMTVDTQTMGYSYDLEDLETPFHGCSIAGTWYEPLGDMELYEVLQELRDLVRYTPLEVFLNGKKITRDPSKETWQYQDEFAYYRFHREGSVAIYNQGVLVRHDRGADWGAGGLIVTKKAIGLNVSRTEILRKTCTVWKAIAAMGKLLAREYADDPTARKGENARALQARQMKVATGEDLAKMMSQQEVFTILPGKAHTSLARLIYLSDHVTAIAPGSHPGELSKGESIAYTKQAVVIHPITLERFECADAEEFQEVLDGMWERLTKYKENLFIQGQRIDWSARRLLDKGRPVLLPFEAVAATFKHSTQVIPDQRLPVSLRRQWTALRWCLSNYATVVSGQGHIPHDDNGRVPYRTNRFHILLGESSMADAWTNGQDYIAINIKEVKRLSKHGLKAAHRIFSLVDHELAHEGDSLDATHDETFFNRYHDISINHAELKQFYVHRFAKKYLLSLERGKPHGWAQRSLSTEDRLSKAEGRTRSDDSDVSELEPLETTDAVLALVNAGLPAIGSAFDEDELKRQIELARERQAAQREEDARYAEMEEEERRHYEAWQAEMEAEGYSDEPRDEEHHQAAEDNYETARRAYEEQGNHWHPYNDPRPVAEALGRAVTEEEEVYLRTFTNTFALAHFVRTQGRLPQKAEDWTPDRGWTELSLWQWAKGAQHLRIGNWFVEQRLAQNVRLALADYLLQREQPGLEQ